MSKSLVAYFSATGNTRNLAENLANATNSDLFEIIPETPYTAEDLNWNNPQSRSSIEMQNKSFRPPVKNTVENMEDYDTIYVGFPIWWYVAPTIINTFLEQYDLSGKDIIPFATSGSSQMGNTCRELADSCPGANLHEGKRFSWNTSTAELKDWAKSC